MKYDNIFDNTCVGFTKLERMELTEDCGGFYHYIFKNEKKLEQWSEIKSIHI